MSIFDSIKHAGVSIGLVEDEPVQHSSSKPEPTQAPQPSPTYTLPTYTPAYVPPASGTNTLSALVGAASTSVSSPEADGIYQKLVDKTNFDDTSVAAVLQQYLAPLAALGLTPGQQFKAAISQAKAHENLTEDAILAVFDTLKDSLSSLNSSLQDKAAQFEQAEITGRQNRLNEIAQQLAQLQAEQTQVTAELAEAQGKGARTNAAVQAAVARRAADIDGQKATYAALMK